MQTLAGCITWRSLPRMAPHTHTHTHIRTHARMHARTHCTHTQRPYRLAKRSSGLVGTLRVTHLFRHPRPEPLFGAHSRFPGCVAGASQQLLALCAAGCSSQDLRTSQQSFRSRLSTEVRRSGSACGAQSSMGSVHCSPNEGQVSSTLLPAIAAKQQHKQKIMTCTERSMFKDD